MPLKDLGKIALVAETDIHCDLEQRLVRSNEQFRGAIDTKLIEQIGEAFAEFPVDQA